MMKITHLDANEPSRLIGDGLSRKPIHWLELVAGLLLIAGFMMWMGQDGVPQGPSREMYRHALRSGLDSTALFYSEVDEMPYYETTVTPWRQAE